MAAKTNNNMPREVSASPVLLDYAAARANLPQACLADWIGQFPGNADDLLDFELLLMEVAADPVAESAEILDPLGQLTLAKVLDEALGPAPAFAGVVARAKALGLTLTQLAERLGLRNATDVLLSLDKRHLIDLPEILIARLSRTLACEIDEIRHYLSQRPALRGLHNKRELKDVSLQSFRAAIEQSRTLNAADLQEWLRILDAEPTSP